MQSGVEPQSLSIAIGRVSLVSVPHDSMPQKLDWHRWVQNMSVRFEHFERPGPRRIFLLDDGEGGASGAKPVSSLPLARENLQSIDLLNMAGSWPETTLALTHGSWKFSLSSWLESYKQICAAKFVKDVGTLLQEQIALWVELSGKLHDDSYFVLSDQGSRFVNVSEICQSWLNRIIRSRVVPEPRTGAWASGAFVVHAPGEGLGRKIRLQRILVVEPSGWCGNPKWHEAFQTDLAKYLMKATECWISAPTCVLTLDIDFRLLRLRGGAWTLCAPSTVTGWHPLRDFMTFLSCAKDGSIFVYLDVHERLQFVVIEEGGPPS